MARKKRTYKIHFCLSGSKRKIQDTYVFDDREVWEWECERLPYDIIDDDEYNVWFDFGDE